MLQTSCLLGHGREKGSGAQLIILASCESLQQGGPTGVPIRQCQRVH